MKQARQLEVGPCHIPPPWSLLITHQHQSQDFKRELGWLCRSQQQPTGPVQHSKVAEGTTV